MYNKNQKTTVRIGGREIDIEVTNFTLEHSIEGAYPSARFEGYVTEMRDMSDIAGRHRQSAMVELTVEKGAETIIKDLLAERGLSFDESTSIYKIGDNMKYAEEEKTCDDSADYSAHSLAKRVVDLDLSDEEKLLRKYNITRDDGTLTAAGKELLLTLVFDEYTNEVIEALEKLEAAKKKESGRP